MQSKIVKTNVHVGSAAILAGLGFQNLGLGVAETEEGLLQALETGVGPAGSVTVDIGCNGGDEGTRLVNSHMDNVQYTTTIPRWKHASTARLFPRVGTLAACRASTCYDISKNSQPTYMVS